MKKIFVLMLFFLIFIGAIYKSLCNNYYFSVNFSFCTHFNPTFIFLPTGYLELERFFANTLIFSVLI